MPHIPRRFSQTHGVSPELTFVPRQPHRAKKPPVPYHGASQGEQAPEPRSQTQMVPRLSMRDFQVPVEKIARKLYGQEVQIDEYTRELVRKTARTPQGRTAVDLG